MFSAVALVLTLAQMPQTLDKGFVQGLPSEPTRRLEERRLALLDLYFVASPKIQQVDKALAEARRTDAPAQGWPVPYIPNGYRKGTPVPAMPGAGEPYLDSHEPLARSSFATDRR
jgi:hypothetical protein